MMAHVAEGQLWRRKSDGVLVLITWARHSPTLGYSLARWKRLDNGRTGDLDFGSLNARYAFVGYDRSEGSKP